MPTISVPSWSVSLLEVVEIWLTYLMEKLHCEAKVGFETKVKSGPSKKKLLLLLGFFNYCHFISERLPGQHCSGQSQVVSSSVAIPWAESIFFGNTDRIHQSDILSGFFSSEFSGEHLRKKFSSARTRSLLCARARPHVPLFRITL